MKQYVLALLILSSPISLFGDNGNYDTISVKPIGLDYSKYSGTNKLFMVGQCDGMTGNQVVVFQNRPAFEYFESNQEFIDEQKELEKAIWSQILDEESGSLELKGRWHKYNDRMIFLCHQILKIGKKNPI